MSGAELHYEMCWSLLVPLENASKEVVGLQIVGFGPIIETLRN